MELTKKQLYRKEQLNKALAGLCTNRELAMELNITIGHAKTIKRRYKESGDNSLVHGNTGHIPKHAISQKETESIIKIWNSINSNGQRIFENCNFSHFSDCLKDYYGINRCRNTISKILKDAGYVSPKKHKNKKKSPTHERRQPRERIGELIQGDATPYEWFEDGHKYALHALIDDATKLPVGMFMTKNECSFGYYESFRYMLLNYGRPEALYVDKLSVFFYNNKNQKKDITEQLEEDDDSKTQFAQSCEKLGIELIPANSPQAKGRVERFWELVQSRLPVELKIRNITTVEEANLFLPEFMKIIGKRFSVKPAKEESAFLKLTQKQTTDLAKILAVKVKRTTDSGCIFSLKNYLFKAPGISKQKITVYLSIQDGIYAETTNGKRVELELFDEDSSGNRMPQVWKDLIEDYFLKDAKAKYRFVYKKTG